MTPALGAIFLVVASMAWLAAGWTLRAMSANPPLQTRYPPQTMLAVYLTVALAGSVGAGVCLGVA